MSSSARDRTMSLAPFQEAGTAPDTSFSGEEASRLVVTVAVFIPRLESVVQRFLVLEQPVRRPVLALVAPPLALLDQG
jgi:hypothetical protein